MTPSASILVVEDEFLVAMQIEAVLREAGYSVIGPAGTLASAAKLARSAACDGAVLDVNLRGERVDEVAAILSERGIPFLFVSGYGRENLPQAFRDGAEFLVKPFSDQTLVRTVRGLLTREEKGS
jgi:DNA-binding response OmpR family regulator